MKGISTKSQNRIVQYNLNTIKDRLLTNAKAFAKDVFIDQERKRGDRNGGHLPFAPGTELVERSPAAPFSVYLNS